MPEETWIKTILEKFAHNITFGIFQGFKMSWGETLKKWDEFLLKRWEFFRLKASEVEAPMWENMLKPYKDAGLLTDDMYQNLLKLKDSMTPFDIIFYIIITLQMTYNYMDVTMDAPKAMMQHQQNKALRPGMPSPFEVMNAAFVAPERTGEVKEVMKALGLTDEHIELLFLARYRLYDENMIRVLFFRGELDNDAVFMRMRELGYTDTRTKEIMESWDIIPPIPDILTMIGREAFEPEMIAHIGLGDEPPVEAYPWLKKLGLNQHWIDKYWYAHWDMPSIQQGYEMLQRRVITEDELDMLFKAVEIPPFWRSKLKQISYLPLTRVDVRRMHDMNVLDTDGVYWAYRDLGYNDEKAKQMTAFTIQYNQQNDKELSMAQIIKGYKERAIERDDADDLLKQIGYSADQSSYLLTFEDYKLEKEYEDDLVDNIRDLYQQNHIDRREAETQLDALNLPAKQSRLLLEKWEIKRLKDRKVPSKSELKAMFNYKVIDQDEYRVEMRKLGYSHLYIDRYEKLNKAQVEEAIRKAKEKVRTG